MNACFAVDGNARPINIDGAVETAVLNARALAVMRRLQSLDLRLLMASPAFFDGGPRAPRAAARALESIVLRTNRLRPEHPLTISDNYF
jgi:hypothetical protein